MNKKFQILISVFAGIAAAILIAGYVNSLETKYKKAAKKVPVVITKKYIDAGEMISPEDVEVKLIPQEYLQPRAIQKAQDLLTEKGFLLYMAAVPIDKGEQVVGTKLFPLGQGDRSGFCCACRHEGCDNYYEQKRSEQNTHTGKQGGYISNI